MVSFRAHLAPALKGPLASRLCISVTLVAVLASMFLALRARADGTDSPVASWLATQTNVHSWSADFVQTRTFKSLVQPLTATGHVWFVEPNQFHWELGHPPQTIAVKSADEMMLIYPRLKR